MVLRLSTLKLIQHGQREVPLDTPYHALLSFALLAGMDTVCRLHWFV